jgi:hypothetical protein
LKSIVSTGRPNAEHNKGAGGNVKISRMLGVGAGGVKLTA